MLNDLLFGYKKGLPIPEPRRLCVLPDIAVACKHSEDSSTGDKLELHVRVTIAKG